MPSLGLVFLGFMLLLIVTSGAVRLAVWLALFLTFTVVMLREGWSLSGWGRLACIATCAICVIGAIWSRDALWPFLVIVSAPPLARRL
jgi:hypothetical protein